ncbi:MAG: hypothetical protein VX265_18475 [Myxococcota bacterium]|nr:hypothetical protein [Myxococcota bacterium]
MLVLLFIACAQHAGGLETAAVASGAHAVPRPLHAAVDAAPGSAAALHKAAVAAAQVGDLAEAVALAREAYVAEPDRRRHRYVQLLESRLADAGGVAALP